MSRKKREDMTDEEHRLIMAVGRDPEVQRLRKLLRLYDAADEGVHEVIKQLNDRKAEIARAIEELERVSKEEE